MAKRKSAKKIQQERELYTWFTVIIVVALLIIAYMKTGLVGSFLNHLFCFIFGEFYYLVVVYICIMAILFVINKRKKFLNGFTVASSVLLVLALLLFASYNQNHDLTGFDIINDIFANAIKYFNGELINKGGLIGAFMLSITTWLFGYKGTLIVLFVVILIAFMLLIPVGEYQQIGESVKSFLLLPFRIFQRNDDEDEEDDEDIEEEYETEEVVKHNTGRVQMINVDGGPAYPSNTRSRVFIDVDKEKENKEAKIINDVDSDDIPLYVDTAKKQEEPVVVEQNEQDKKAVKTSGPYKIPSVNILDSVSATKKNNKNVISAKQKGERLIEILDNFQISAKLVATHIGPSVTKFEVRPEASVKVSKINSIADNIKMELAATDIRIEAPIPGKNTVGVEIPNVESTIVKMKELMTSIPEDKKDKPLLFALGKDLMGTSVFCQLDKMPHLLVAGQTGSGKSVCMNTIITSFLLRCSCDDVKLLLIDPKKVEFTPYHNIPHLLGPVISDPNQASAALKVIVNIMEERYEVFSLAGVRNISVYNEKVKADPTDANLKPMPYIVVIIDELADLMAVAGKEVELSIQRITQLARAAGIHLIVATQRPSTDVITGIIKANIPSRIAFKTASGIDSRTILDTVGSERLLGNGDMLYYPTGSSSPIRLQGAYINDDEVKRVCDACASQRAPLYDDAFIRLEGVEGNENTAVMQACDDPLYEEIKEYVIEVQKASASLLQRRFGIGYNRAARMIDVLEDKGIIGPQQGSKPREVYAKKDN